MKCSCLGQIGFNMSIGKILNQPTPKRELMARLYAERKAAGLQKCSFWLTEDQRKKVNELLKSL